MKYRHKGLTLMEILIALFIFSFASLYISRTVTRLLKQKKKIEREVKDRRGHSNILEILRQDLKGVMIHFDINSHLNQFALSELSEFSEIEAEKIPFEGRSFINSQFDFFGEEDLLTFTAFVPLAGEEEAEKLVKVSYFTKQCIDRETDQSALCLIRGVSDHWTNREDTENQKSKVLIRGLKDITFSYYHPEKKEWERNWSFLPLWKEVEARPTRETVLLPPSVQVNMEWEGDSSSYTFPVSHTFLRAFRPDSFSPLVYLNISKKSEIPPPDDKSSPPDKDTPSDESGDTDARSSPDHSRGAPRMPNPPPVSEEFVAPAFPRQNPSPQ